MFHVYKTSCFILHTEVWWTHFMRCFLQYKLASATKLHKWPTTSGFNLTSCKVSNDAHCGRTTKHLKPEENPSDWSRLQASSHGNNVLRKTIHFYGSEAAKFGVKVEHPAITLPQLAECSFGTWNVVEKGIKMVFGIQACNVSDIILQADPATHLSAQSQIALGITSRPWTEDLRPTGDVRMDQVR